MDGLVVMPGLVPGIHVFVRDSKQDVDGRDKPGHDGNEQLPCEIVYINRSISGGISGISAGGIG
ncbi:hypothetical protein ACMYR2_0519 [Nitrobacter sp. TKz-YC01]